MTGPGDQPDRMVEVSGLAAAIADRILEQNDEGTSIPPEHFHMLVRAAQMLEDNAVPWSPSVERVVMEVAKRVEVDEAARLAKDAEYQKAEGGLK